MKNNFCKIGSADKKSLFCSLLLFSIFLSNVCAQSHISSQSHQSAVTDLCVIENIIGEENTVFSAGNDGFLVKWTDDGLGEHYQISDLSIRSIARSPNGTDVAVYTTDGASTNIVSVWNFKTLTRKYAYKFTDPITCLSYSAKGTFVLCGTASVKGTYFLNTANGTITAKTLKESTGAVSMIETSDSENTAIAYSPSGALTYYNLKTGERKARFGTESNLSHPCMFNNFVFMAGTIGNTIYIIQATTGKTLKTFKLNSTPILIGSNRQQDLYYIINENLRFRLYRIENDRNKTISEPQLIRTFTGLKSAESIVCAVTAGQTVYAGTSAGNIYKFDTAVSERVDTLLALTDNMYEQIYDIASIGDDFYFLSPDSIFLSSYDNGIVYKKASNPGYTNLVPYNENIILWSKGTHQSVVLLDIQNGTRTQLFTPSNNLQSIRLFGDSLVFIEGNSSVSRFDFDTRQTEQLYSGTGIQDAVLYNETDLYVAKSGATNPPSPLLYVNTRTKETVPLSINGTVAYALCVEPQQSQAQSRSSREIYGVLISNASSQNQQTSIFAYNPQTKTARTFLTTSDEDGNAFSFLSSGILYTNIGKSQVISYNILLKRKFEYKRSASMPLKVARNKNRLAVLNRDGSVSWYNPSMSGVLADWYLTTDGSWFEF